MSFSFKAVLTFPNTGSRGFRSGEYGGRKSSFAPVMLSSVWWIDALSIITTDNTLTVLKGFSIGNEEVERKCENLYNYLYLLYLLLNRHHEYLEST